MCDLAEPRIWEEHTVKARKEYRCSDCGQTIRRGELHIIMEGLYDDTGWSRDRVHTYCREWRAAHQRWQREYWGEDCGAELGGLISALVEAQFEIGGRNRPKLALVGAST